MATMDSQLLLLALTSGGCSAGTPRPVDWDKSPDWEALQFDGDELRSQPAADVCPAVAKAQPCPLPKGCVALSATSTDSNMKWRCQAPGRSKTVYRHYTDCTDQHVVCTPPDTQQPQQQGRVPSRNELVVFLPGTGLVPQDYSRIIADFASHGFHSIGLMYPSTQGQVDCQMSRVANPTDLNCTARERYRVLTGEASSFGGTDTHTNITQPDSIVNRVAMALKALGPPWSGWLAADGSPRWADIIIAGHSNGADHTGFLAKTFSVSRALMFAGANDMVGVVLPHDYVHPAPWQFAAGATPPSRLFGFGVCGTKAHHASGICWDWHAGWGAQQLPGAWFRTDAVLASGSLSGYHKLCSNGSLVNRTLSQHMASAGDCCVPLFGADAGALAGKMIWTRVYEHMLTAPIDAPLGPATAGESCACVAAGIDSKTPTKAKTDDPAAQKPSPCASVTADGLCCNPGALNVGPMLHVANLTLAAATRWCNTSAACSGFTAKSNPKHSKSITDQCLDTDNSAIYTVYFKAMLGGNADPLWWRPASSATSTAASRATPPVCRLASRTSHTRSPTASDSATPRLLHLRMPGPRRHPRETTITLASGRTTRLQVTYLDRDSMRTIFNCQ